MDESYGMRERQPIVSVILAVFNGAELLSETVNSVLEQTLRDLELIIVDDGSSDPEIAARLSAVEAADSRVTVLREEHQGLTASLIVGCAVAVGHYLGRIDVGDRYHPEKLERQVAFLTAHSDVVLLSCATRFSTVEGDLLFEEIRTESPADATARLRSDNLRSLRGVTSHPAILMRRSEYEQVGGYRSEFYFAQDVDLWMRLTDHGQLAFTSDVLYEATISPSGISGKHSRQQRRLAELAIALRKQREAGSSEKELLIRASCIRPESDAFGRLGERIRLARGECFVAILLAAKKNPRAWSHYRNAFALNPFSPRVWRHVIFFALRHTRKN